MRQCLRKRVSSGKCGARIRTECALPLSPLLKRWQMLSGINHLEQKSYLLLFFVVVVVVVFFFPSLLAVCAVHIPSIFVSSSHHGHHPEAAYVCGAENSAHLNSALLRLREVIFQTPIPRGKSIHCGVFLRGISPFSRLPEGGKKVRKKKRNISF